ncbi:hypothetical protein [Pseudoclavibacter sp. 13-3]|uniref:hypothetical protein n=1 Tax=Pseudoclavibacter sp. 13-3 TaxID=2901228 RepID=UPI001E3B5059|nr:hypothetical protein [Pseudoclavibacter sp. 13-3]MCD7101960.1 hypothetical protein [Pseudoclavibacter sp. 13-3]
MIELFAERPLEEALAAARTALDRRIVAGSYDRRLPEVEPAVLAAEIMPDPKPVTVLWLARTAWAWLSNQTGLEVDEVVTAAIAAEHLHAAWPTERVTEAQTTSELAALVGDKATVARMGRAIEQLGAFANVFGRLDVRPTPGAVDRITAELRLPTAGANTAYVREILGSRPNPHALGRPAANVSLLGPFPTITVEGRANDVELGQKLAAAQLELARWGAPQLASANAEAAAWATEQRPQIEAMLTARRDMLAAVDRLSR